MIVTSNRKFGIEIEFVAPTPTALSKIRNNITVVEDGSLRPLLNAGEYVSEPLKGKTGEETIRFACEVLKKHGASGDNPKTSVHLHLDGRIGQGTLRSSRTPAKTTESQIGVSNRLKQELGSENIMNLLLRRGLDMNTRIEWIESRFDNILYLSKAQLTSKPRLNYTYYYLDKPDRFEWMRNVFYFYTKFSDVMEAMVSDSRKFGNMYCIPLGKSYDCDRIAECNSMDSLKGVWYKGRPSAGHYDDSRYHNVNLHCFWDRHGTVEIRSHGGTIDPNKILLWLRLHQTIVDKLEEVKLEELVALGNIPQEFINFVGDGMLKDYIKRLLGFYSGIKI